MAMGHMRQTGAQRGRFGDAEDTLIPAGPEAVD